MARRKTGIGVQKKVSVTLRANGGSNGFIRNFDTCVTNCKFIVPFPADVISKRNSVSV